MESKKRYLSNEFNKIWDKIEKGENITLFRYGDGERAVMTGRSVTAQEGWVSPDGISEFGKRLYQTLNHLEENVYYGISCPCCDNEAYYWYSSRIESKNITFANIFVNSNYKQFISNFEKLTSDAVFIGNYRAKDKPIGNLNIIKRYYVDDDCFEFYKNEYPKFLEQIKYELGNKNNLLYVVSAGPLSEILISDLYKNNPNNCYIDFGSSIDKYIHEKQTRPYMDSKTIYAKQHCEMYNPKNTNFDVTVVLTAYKRIKNLGVQLEAIKKQSLKPKEILLFQDGIDSGEKIEIPEEIKSEFNIVEISETNKGVWARFDFARRKASSKYVCIFDDDTIPAHRWLENCLTEMHKQEGLYGTIGILCNSEAYAPNSHIRVGWANPNNKTTQVDFVGHCWFLKTSWLEYMFQNTEELQKYKICAEDMSLSFKLQEQNIKTFVPPHPENNKDLWGSMPEYSNRFGTDCNSLFESNGWTKMTEAFNLLVTKYNFKIVKNTNNKYYKNTIKELSDKSKFKILNKIFSIRNEESKNFKRKVITILGIKIKKPIYKNCLTVVIPTLLKDEELLNELVLGLTKDKSVKEIIVINNKADKIYTNDNEKVRVISPKENLFVNPSWNLGVEEATTNFVLLLNDDLKIPTNFCYRVISRFKSNTGVVGMSSGSVINVESNVKNKKLKNKRIRFKEINSLNYNFGTAIFFNKNNFIPIPSELKIYYGDNYIIETMKSAGKKNYHIKGQKIYHYGSMTSSAFSQVMADEEKEYLKYYSLN